MFITTISIIVAVSFQVKSSYAAPVLFLENSSFDFGNVSAGVDVYRKIPIANRGNAPLRVSKIEASCGCIKKRSMLDTNVIAPGKTQFLEVVISTPTHSRSVFETLILHTNDFYQPLQKIDLKAKVASTSERQTSLINLGIIDENELPLRREVEIQPARSVGDQYTPEIQNSSDIIKARVVSEKLVLDRSTHKLVIEIPKDAPLGPIDTDLHLKIGTTHVTTYTILGKVTGSIYADPDEINVQLRHDTSTTEELAIKVDSGSISALQVKLITDKIRRHVTVTATKKNDIYILIFHFRASDKSVEDISGNILLDVTIGDGKSKQINIPIKINQLPEQ